MRAVVLAAGRGRRLFPQGKEAKVLHRLLGLTLLDRVILSARDAGVSEFVVVTGYRAEEVEAYVGDGSRWDVTATCVRNRRWPEGNGTSLLAARSHVEGEPFLVLMGDHVLDVAILRAFLAKKPMPPVVAVDPRIETIPDPEEALKVRLEGDRVVATGRDLVPADGVDCGVFLFHDTVFDVLRKTTAAGRGALSDATETMAQAGLLRAWPIPATWWFDLDTPHVVRQAEEAMLRHLVKKEDGPVARHLNRPLSLRISRRAVEWPLTPDHWTLLSFATALAAAALLAVGAPLAFVLGGVLVQLASILDGVDGEVARLRHVASPRGGWFDAVLDRYADIAILFGLAVGGWQMGPDILLWPLLGLALAGALMVSYTSARYEGAGLGPAPVGGLPAKRDVRLFVVFVGAVLQAPLATLAVVAALAHGEVLRRLLAWRRGSPR